MTVIESLMSVKDKGRRYYDPHDGRYHWTNLEAYESIGEAKEALDEFLRREADALQRPNRG